MVVKVLLVTSVMIPQTMTAKDISGGGVNDKYVYTCSIYRGSGGNFVEYPRSIRRLPKESIVCITIMPSSLGDI